MRAVPSVFDGGIRTNGGTKMSGRIAGRTRALLALGGLVAVAVLAVPQAANASPKPSELVTKHAIKTLDHGQASSDGTVRGNAGKPQAKPTTNGINYHGGPVMTG